MDRLACVDVPVLPLQLLLRERPAWASGPVAVVEEDAPLGVITHINEAARQRGVVPGLKYGEALSLCAQLHAAVVAPEKVAAAVAELLALLRNWSPAIEPSADEPGVLWADVNGLSQLFPSLEDWGAKVMAALREAGWRATLCVGFKRFGSYAVAKAMRVDQVRLLLSVEEEKQLQAKVPLRRVGLEPTALIALKKLGIETLGQFLTLPVGGLRKRYGEAAERLSLLAGGKRVEPFQPAAVVVPVEARLDFDEPVLDSNQLVFSSLSVLRQLMKVLEERQLALRTLSVTLGFDRPRGVVNAPLKLNVALAEATLDGARVTEQVRLTLSAAIPSPCLRGEGQGEGPIAKAPRVLSIIEGEGVATNSSRPSLVVVPPVLAALVPLPNPLPAGRERESLGVQWIFFEAGGAPATTTQLALVDRPRRDPSDTSRTLERIRAAFGPLALQQLVHGPGHLPESRLQFEQLQDAPPAASPTSPTPLRIRRMRFKAERLPARPTREPDGWLVLGERGGPVVKHHGPYFLNGGWWRREVNRHYYFLELARGAVVWCYLDVLRRRWMLQGFVE